MLILASPHVSRLDGPALSAWLSRRGLRRVLFAVDPDYSRHLLWRWILSGYGRLQGEHRMVALDSRHPHGLRRMIRAHREGWHIALFPQGIGLGDPDRPEQPGATWLIRRLAQEYSTAATPLEVYRVRMRHDRFWPRPVWETSDFSYRSGRDRHFRGGNHA